MEYPEQTDVKFRLGSITKQFTSMLILQLVEQGKLSLEAKLSDALDAGSPQAERGAGAALAEHHRPDGIAERIW